MKWTCFYNIFLLNTLTYNMFPILTNERSYLQRAIYRITPFVCQEKGKFTETEYRLVDCLQSRWARE